MKNWRTTLCGALAALSLSGFAGLGLAAPWPAVLLFLCAAALGGLGYHSTDCAHCPGNAARLAALGVVIVCVAAVASCTLSHMQLGVSSPAIGMDAPTAAPGTHAAIVVDGGK